MMPALFFVEVSNILGVDAKKNAKNIMPIIASALFVKAAL